MPRSTQDGRHVHGMGGTKTVLRGCGPGICYCHSVHVDAAGDVIAGKGCQVLSVCTPISTSTIHAQLSRYCSFHRRN